MRVHAWLLRKQRLFCDCYAVQQHRAGPDFFEAQGETIIRGPLHIHDIDSTKCKSIYIILNCGCNSNIHMKQFINIKLP